MDASQSFFDRERELAQLEAASAAPGAQLVMLWGRRRVGKSALLARFSAGKRAVYLRGTRMTERGILTGLAIQAADVFDDPDLRAASQVEKGAALDYLTARARIARLQVVFDEFPYLCEVTPGWTPSSSADGAGMDHAVTRTGAAARPGDAADLGGAARPIGAVAATEAIMASETVSILDGNTFVVSDRRGDIVASPSQPTGLSTATPATSRAGG